MKKKRNFILVFERHFTDQPFDRFGQISLIITAGIGVFKVERELANMTKQRILNNGIGSDLVCLGEQPLFAVPLLELFKENSTVPNDYQIAHWIKLRFELNYSYQILLDLIFSYYHRSTAPSCFRSYIPRLSFDRDRIKDGLLGI